MEKDKAFIENYSYDAKENKKKAIELVVNHPLITTQDLLRIKKMKVDLGPAWGTSPLYHSNHLNTALVNSEGISKKEVLSTMKKMQYDLKIAALKRDDLTEDETELVLEYSIKHHGHIPDQMTEILKADEKEDLLKDKEFKDRIIKHLKKKYQKGSNWQSKPNGLKFLDVMISYGWLDALDEMTDKDKNDIIQVIASAYTTKKHGRPSISKDRILKITNKLGNGKEYLLIKLHELTGDEDFLPEDVKDIFIF